MATTSRKVKISSSGRSSITFKSNIDRISKLPDSILCEILSYLPTRLAVSTSILSKRWRFLWTSVPNLDFDDDRPCVDFASIVNRVLFLRREWGIRRFRIRWRSCFIFHPMNFDSWVFAAIARDVQELDFEVMWQVAMPCALFYCKTLLILKLNGRGQALDVPSSAFLPNLKTLHLRSLVFKDEDSSYNLFLACPLLRELVCTGMYPCNKNPVKCHFANRDCFQKLVTLRLTKDIVLCVASNVHFPKLTFLILQRVVYKDENSARNLISCCPVLRNLYVERSDEDNTLCYEISSATLKRLIYKFTDCVSPSSSYTLRVNTPALKYLVLDDSATQRFYIENMGSVVVPTVRNSNHFQGFQALCHVTSLDLDNSFKPILNMSFDKLPEFLNLVELRLEKFCCSGVLLHMLPKFPRLERLTLYKGIEDDEEQCKMPAAPQLLHSPNCLAIHLRTLSFSEFKGLDVEMEFMSYIFKNSLVLEQVKIYAVSALRLNSDRRFAALQKLAGFERGSKKCKLEFL